MRPDYCSHTLLSVSVFAVDNFFPSFLYSFAATDGHLTLLQQKFELFGGCVVIVNGDGGEIGFKNCLVIAAGTVVVANV